MHDLQGYSFQSYEGSTIVNDDDRVLMTTK